MGMLDNKNDKPSHEKDVIIIGAGAAGLGAAQHLVKHGFKDIVIFEAANRIGGRVHTIKFGTTADRIVELGANWIHGGSPTNPLYEQMITHRLFDDAGKIPQWRRFDKSHFYKPEEQIIDPTISKRAVDIFFEEDKAVAKLWSEPTNDFNGQYDVLSNLKHRLIRRLDRDFQQDQAKDARHTFNAMLNYLRAHVGDDLHKASALYYGTYQEIPGGDIIVPRGFQNLLEIIAKQLPSDCIRTNHTVTRIEWNASNTSRSHPIVVECQNGNKWQTKHVIVTISIGCLKKYHQKLFEPALPRFKVDAIEKIGFGCTNKIFLQFEHPFPKYRTGNMILTWEDENESVQQVNKQSLAWERNIFSFDEVYENPNVLVGWVAGDEARNMEKLTDRQVTDKCVDVLKRFTGNRTIPSIKRIARSNWSSDPFILGSYSYASNRSGPEHVEWLSEPLPSVNQPQLLFCGEATHPSYYSTVHGAFSSGIREADRIIKFNKSKLCNL